MNDWRKGCSIRISTLGTPNDLIWYSIEQLVNYSVSDSVRYPVELSISSVEDSVIRDIIHKNTGELKR